MVLSDCDNGAVDAEAYYRVDRVHFDGAVIFLLFEEAKFCFEQRARRECFSESCTNRKVKKLKKITHKN